MTTTPFVIDTFGGLNLRADPTEVGFNGAVNLLDVDLDRNGRLRTRNGSLKYNASTLAAAGYQQIYPYAAPSGAATLGDLLAIRSSSATTQIDRITGGAGTTTNLGSVAGNSPVTYSATALGTLTATVLYMTFADYGVFSGLTIRKWDGASLTTGTGKPTYAATWPTSNRLVQGGYFAAADSPSGANGSRATVFFSDAGAPDTYTATSFVTLRPGDGEVITAIVSWREMLFVFKQSAVFIFYGESTDNDGQPIFNYRRVDLPSPVSDPVVVGQGTSVIYAVAGPDAVYYSTAAGIYRTAGGVPDLFSGAVDPLFSADADLSSSLRVDLTKGPPSLAYVGHRLVCSYTNVAAAVRQLVWDEPTGMWTVWSLPSKSWAGFTPGSVVSLSHEAIWFPTGNNVAAMSPAYATDDGAAITWSYTSGMYSLSDTARAAVTLESRVWGTGAATLKISNDAAAFDTGSSLTLGTAPTLADAWQQIDREGVLWQHQLSGSGRAVVSRLAHYVSFVKPSGIQ